MSQQDVSVLKAAYEAFNRGDIPAVVTAFAPDIIWREFGGGHAPRGTFHGVQSVVNDVFATIPQNFTDFGARPSEFIDAVENIVVVGHFQGKTKSGQQLDTPFAHLWTMQNGKATNFVNYVAAEPWAKAWS